LPSTSQFGKEGGGNWLEETGTTKSLTFCSESEDSMKSVNKRGKRIARLRLVWGKKPGARRERVELGG